MDIHGEFWINKKSVAERHAFFVRVRVAWLGSHLPLSFLSEQRSWFRLLPLVAFGSIILHYLLFCGLRWGVFHPMFFCRPYILLLYLHHHRAAVQLAPNLVHHPKSIWFTIWVNRLTKLTLQKWSPFYNRLHFFNGVRPITEQGCKTATSVIIYRPWFKIYCPHSSKEIASSKSNILQGHIGQGAF